MADPEHTQEKCDRALCIRRWKRGRHFALFDEQGDLIVVTVYKKGAEEVKRRLKLMPPEPRRHAMKDEGKTVLVKIPTFAELLAGLPEAKQNHQVRSALLAAYQCELQTMLNYAMAESCREPMLTMSLLKKAGEQHIAEFAVSDLALPEQPGKVNFHGQNVSRWQYAGAIVVENGQVSRHH